MLLVITQYTCLKYFRCSRFTDFDSNDLYSLLRRNRLVINTRIPYILSDHLLVYSATRLSVAIQQTFKFEKYILQLNHPCDVQTLLYFTLLNFNYTDLNTQYKLKMNEQLK